MIWAPDSKRFAFSYRDHGSHGYISESAAFYELRGDKWKNWVHWRTTIRGQPIGAPIEKHLLEEV